MKNKNNIIKIVYFLILLIGFTGCYTYYTVPTVATSPTYVFKYDGNVEESYSEIKKEIFRNELTAFAHEDRYSAILVTDLKKLLPDEMYYPYLFFVDPSDWLIFNKQQEGILVFLFTNLGDDKTKIEFYTKTFVELSVRTGRNDETKIETISPPKHPFLQKYVEIFSKIPKISW
jgi:hypothetical protein